MLENACNSYDSGLKPSGKHIALILRVLLHHHKQSQSLFQQLNLRTKRFLDTTEPFNTNLLTPYCPLCVVDVIGSNYIPLCLTQFPSPMRWIPFPEWWNNCVVKDNKGHSFSRRELILNIADTDGGAHDDPELDENYMKLSRENSLGWHHVEGNSIDEIMKSQGSSSSFTGPELPCVRQIAHEILVTLKTKAKDFLLIKYGAAS